MEKVILWLFLIGGLILLFFGLRKSPTKEMIVAYLLTSYFTIILGVIPVEEKMLDYPVKFMDDHFETSLLFEYLWLPLAVVYFYHTTYHSKVTGIVLQALLYTSGLTIIEFFLEKYTDVIEYYTWTLLDTFVSIFLLMLFIRFLMTLFNRWKGSLPAKIRDSVRPYSTIHIVFISQLW